MSNEKEFELDINKIHFDPEGRILINDRDFSDAVSSMMSSRSSLSLEIQPLGYVIPDAACPDGDICPDGDNCPDVDAACPDGDNCPDVDVCPDIDFYCPSDARLDTSLIYPINPHEMMIKNGRFAKALVDAKFGPAKRIMLRINNDR
ncbi:hypothetical protein BCV43_15150 [Vibrio cyclitrophicus]|uniref:hypothetical protein n=1 Tax=Vibrio cyclitrophicus TaxID=47951 RepID=UPI000C839F6D|nr:hypothetical protein [Vibrio cyclitrophicus]PME22018.1 hypothetical protein BCV43_06630 [Vibrio cyclitrophicus]